MHYNDAYVHLDLKDLFNKLLDGRLKKYILEGEDRQLTKKIQGFTKSIQKKITHILQ